MKSVYRFFLHNLVLISSTIVLSGCVGLGVAVQGNHETSVNNPRINIEKGGLREGNSKPWITSEDLLKYWGTPDLSQTIDTKTNLWRYNFETRWNGVGVLAVIFPIPLLVPVGHDYIEFRIENNWVVSARTIEDDWIAVYGCMASAVVHASGVACKFGREPDDSLGKKFIHKPHDVYRITVINNSRAPITLVHTTQGNDANRSDEDQLTLKPLQSIHLLSNGYGKEVAAVKVDGNRMTRQTSTDFLSKTYCSDTTIFYLITDDQIISVPVKYWDDWEAHVPEIINRQPPSQ